MESEPSLDRLVELTDGNRAEMQELLDLYLEQTSAVLADLRTAFTASAWEQVRFQAHKGAGSSSTCGLWNVERVLREIELNAGKVSASDLAVAVNRADTELQRVRDLRSRSFNS
jgi:HPt (histidine-containing phosphotransfer) domain-containing protein